MVLCSWRSGCAIAKLLLCTANLWVTIMDSYDLLEAAVFVSETRDMISQCAVAPALSAQRPLPPCRFALCHEMVSSQTDKPPASPAPQSSNSLRWLEPFCVHWGTHLAQHDAAYNLLGKRGCYARSTKLPAGVVLSHQRQHAADSTFHLQTSSMPHSDCPYHALRIPTRSCGCLLPWS